MRERSAIYTPAVYIALRYTAVSYCSYWWLEALNSASDIFWYLDLFPGGSFVGYGGKHNSTTWLLRLALRVRGNNVVDAYTCVVILARLHDVTICLEIRYWLGPPQVIANAIPDLVEWPCVVRCCVSSLKNKVFVDRNGKSPTGKRTFLHRVLGLGLYSVLLFET